MSQHSSISTTTTASTANTTTREIRDIGLSGIAVLPNRMRTLRCEVVDELAQSLSGPNGLLQPIVVRPAEAIGYYLIAGRHRLEAARKLKWDAIRCLVLDELQAAAAQLAEIDENLIRADLTPAERAAHQAARKEIYERLHPETKKGATGRGRKKSQVETSKAPAPAFIDDTAKKTGRSRATVSREAARGAAIPDVAELAGTSLDKGDELDALAKLPEDEQRKLAERAKAGERVSAKTRAKQVRRQEREQQLALKTAAAAIALGQEVPASIIFADPGLRFKVWSENGEDRSPDNHYTTEVIEKIMALKPPSSNTALLLLWTWSPHLENSLAIMRAWGFQYKAYWGWDKEIDGTGYWARSRLDLVLVGTKGKFPCPAPGEQPPQLIRSRRAGHSEKPDDYFEWAERLFPNLIKLEMFARKPRPGWRTWGNEVEPEHAETPPPPPIERGTCQ